MALDKGIWDVKLRVSNIKGTDSGTDLKSSILAALNPKTPNSKP